MSVGRAAIQWGKPLLDKEDSVITRLFREGTEFGMVVLHLSSCDTKDGETNCTCVPITLQRGAKS